MHHAFLLLLALAAPGLDEPARHQGTWSVVSQVRDGKEGPPDVVASIRRVVEGDHVTWTRDGKAFAGTRVEYDASKTPHALDLIPDGGPNRDKHILGIYKLEGDELTICVADVGEPRPTEFEAAAGSKRTLQKFRRIAAPGKAEDLKLLERARLQGSWNLTSQERDGKPIRRPVAMAMLFAGDRRIWVIGGEQDINGWSRVEIDPIRTPAAMDMVFDSGPTRGNDTRGSIASRATG